MSHSPATNHSGCPQVVLTRAEALADPEAPLLALHLRYVDAWAGADRGALDALTARDFLFTDSAGNWIEREQYLAVLREPPVSGSVSCEDVRVRLFGPVAVLHGLLEANGGQDTVRHTIVCQRDGADWHLVHAQNTVLRDGVAKPQRLGEAPACAPWQGEDPAGDDSQVLRALNADYVRAFRECDLAWYDAHLAQDYGVINSDGSFDDRARALAEFARPTFTTHLRSFPVDRVRIRRFEDIALIHAENAYELLDGRRGVNRYTDIWHKQEDGRWLCIAAHITTHRAPSLD